MRAFFLITFNLFLVFGCVTPSSFDEDSKIQIITLKQTTEFMCIKVAPIEAFGKKSMTKGADRRNAIIEFKNKADEIDANAATFTNQLNSKAGVKISGYAWKCENLN